MNGPTSKCWDAYVEGGYHPYMVASIDLLGQKDKLARLAQYSVEDMCNESRPAELKQLEGETFESIIQIRDILNGLILEELVDRDPIGPFREAERSTIAEMFHPYAIDQSSSDAFIYYVCLDGDPHKQAATILRIVCAIAFLMPVAFSHKLPLRGGLEVHWGASIGRGQIYGPAPFRAYDLESQTAQYPRVVLGEGAIRFLRDLALQNDSTHAADTARSLARTVLQMFAEDTDTWFLDYLGYVYHTLRQRESRCRIAAEFLPGAYTFITDSLADFKSRAEQQGDDQEAHEKALRLISRYEQLKAYFVKSLPLWEDDGFRFPAS